MIRQEDTAFSLLAESGVFFVYILREIETISLIKFEGIVRVLKIPLR